MKIFRNIGYFAAITAGISASLLTGCKADNEFDTEEEGTLKLQLVVNSNLTRALENEDYLRSNCVLYISGDGKLIYKYKGLENVPSEIHMKNGSYVAEAWTGDSVGASFDKKFFRGYEPFTINGGQTSVVVKCKIANVGASVNPATIDPAVMKDWKVTFSHSRASLDITEETQSQTGYFMMPNADKDLQYTISGKNAEGKEFVKTGVIENVERAHEYVLNFSYTPDTSQVGGAFIQIVVDDQVMEENSDIPMYSRPSIKGENFDIEQQIIGDPGAFSSEAIAKVSAFGGMKSLELSSPDYTVMGWPGNNLNLVNLTSSPTETMRNRGITWDLAYNADRNLATSFIHLAPAFLNSLPERNTEYTITIAATDIYGKTNNATIHIAVGPDAIIYADPVTAEEPDRSNQMGILATSATLSATINNPEAGNPRIEYREYGTEEWKTAALGTRAAGTRLTVTLKNLKPGTRYEYRAATDDFTGESIYFTTEAIFTIPNASMEEWSDFVKNTKVLIPSNDGTQKFWDSGNHGSTTVGDNITRPTTAFFHTGSNAAELKSQFVGIGIAGKLAAGNIFAGSYDETVGTNGRLTFGQPYNGTHPTKLRVWANYRPAVGVKSKGANANYIAEGAPDIAQIYVALTTEPYKIFTKSGAEQRLFSPTDESVIAYGQYTFEGNYGADGQLQQLDIPIEYYAAAKSKKPLCLVIVASASKYGDFFSGGDGSVLIVDDFELIYE